ncbi:hypothetical protein LTS18_008745, partial [Coniosporium uncinatum]
MHYNQYSGAIVILSQVLAAQATFGLPNCWETCAEEVGEVKCGKWKRFWPGIHKPDLECRLDSFRYTKVTKLIFQGLCKDFELTQATIECAKTKCQLLGMPDYPPLASDFLFAPLKAACDAAGVPISPAPAYTSATISAMITSAPGTPPTPSPAPSTSASLLPPSLSDTASLSASTLPNSEIDSVPASASASASSLSPLPSSAYASVTMNPGTTFTPIPAPASSFGSFETLQTDTHTLTLVSYLTSYTTHQSSDSSLVPAPVPAPATATTELSTMTVVPTPATLTSATGGAGSIETSLSETLSLPTGTSGAANPTASTTFVEVFEGVGA